MKNTETNKHSNLSSFVCYYLKS